MAEKCVAKSVEEACDILRELADTPYATELNFSVSFIAGRTIGVVEYEMKRFVGVDD